MSRWGSGLGALLGEARGVSVSAGRSVERAGVVVVGGGGGRMLLWMLWPMLQRRACYRGGMESRQPGNELSNHCGHDMVHSSLDLLKKRRNEEGSRGRERSRQEGAPEDQTGLRNNGRGEPEHELSSCNSDDAD